jgi:hypothetical protein
MVCPQCRKNTISFLKTWSKSGFGTYRCPGCGTELRVKKSLPLVLGSIFLGGIAAGLSIYFRSWKVLIIASLVVLVLDGVMDFCFRRFEPVEPKAPGKI